MHCAKMQCLDFFPDPRQDQKLFLKYKRCDNIYATRLDNPEAISGFSCRESFLDFFDVKCWSTNGNFPGFCPQVDFRACRNCPDKTIHTSATVGIGAVKNPRKYSRHDFKFINGRWRAVRPKVQES